jgi:hypothetical protein
LAVARSHVLFFGSGVLTPGGYSVNSAAVPAGETWVIADISVTNVGALSDNFSISVTHQAVGLTFFFQNIAALTLVEDIRRRVVVEAGDVIRFLARTGQPAQFLLCGAKLTA